MGTIVIVDDDELVLGFAVEVVGEFLQSTGLDHDLEAFSDSPSAVDALRSKRDIVMVITDCHMPGLTGIEVIEEGIKLGVQRFILMSGELNEEIMAVASALVSQGRIDFVAKPLGVGKLEMTLNDLLV